MSLPRLKWHMLRRRAAEPAHLAANLEPGLLAGAALEVDVVVTKDGHFLCLHDLTLNRETTGTGPVRDADRATIEGLRQRGRDGAALDTAPLFLDEVVETVRRVGAPPTGRLQLDLKEPAERLGAAERESLERTLGDLAPCFTLAGTEWAAVQALAVGTHLGFDPLDLYEEHPPTDAAGFRALAERTLAIAPGVGIYYLYHKLVFAGLEQGVDLIGLFRARGAEVDCWTLDPTTPGIEAILPRLVALGCEQITTNDPMAMAALLEKAHA